jgi:hypothetical protein
VASEPVRYDRPRFEFSEEEYRELCGIFEGALTEGLLRDLADVVADYQAAHVEESKRPRYPPPRRRRGLVRAMRSLERLRADLQQLHPLDYRFYLEPEAPALEGQLEGLQEGLNEALEVPFSPGPDMSEALWDLYWGFAFAVFIDAGLRLPRTGKVVTEAFAIVYRAATGKVFPGGFRSLRHMPDPEHAAAVDRASILSRPRLHR